MKFAESINQMVRNVLGRWGSIIYDIGYFSELLLALIAITLSISELSYLTFGSFVWKIFPVDKPLQNFDTFNFYFCYVLGFCLFFLNV